MDFVYKPPPNIEPQIVNVCGHDVETGVLFTAGIVLVILITPWFLYTMIRIYDWIAYGCSVDIYNSQNWRRAKRMAAKGYTPGKPTLMRGERPEPPKATAFGRIGGKTICVTGPYEPKYLNTWERKHWDWVCDHKKGNKGPQEPENEAKSPKLLTMGPEKPQNAEKDDIKAS
jgi:hypothetical protein